MAHELRVIDEQMCGGCEVCGNRQPLLVCGEPGCNFEDYPIDPVRQQLDHQVSMLLWDKLGEQYTEWMNKQGQVAAQWGLPWPVDAFLLAHDVRVFMESKGVRVDE